MKKLEDRIVKKIFVMETKRTLTEIVIRTAMIIVLALLSVFLVSDIITILVEQQTLDILQLFQEKREVIQKYFGEVMSTLYIEMPKVEIAVTVIIFVLVISCVLLFVKHYKKIKNKVSALKNYWLDR